MIREMMNDLGSFLWVLLPCLLGFGIAFRNLFPNLKGGHFSFVLATFVTLFDAALGSHDFGIFTQPISTDLSCSSHDNCRLSDAENDDIDLSNLSVPGTVLMIVYVTVVMVVLLNLVVARMSASHEKINQSALQEWSTSCNERLSGQK
jgi:hypothetical protein